MDIHTNIHTYICKNWEEVWPGVVRIRSICQFYKILEEEKKKEKKVVEKKE